MRFNNRTLDSFAVKRYRDEFLAGDEKAYSYIYELYVEDLYAYGLSLHAKTELIEDAIHDIFVEIYVHREKLKKVENLKFYFLSAFRNRLFYLIKNESAKVDFTDEKLNGLTENDFQELWIEKEIEEEKSNMTKHLLAELNVHQREVLYHRFVEELSCEEISVLMNINYQSTKNLIYRAIKKLKTVAAFKSLLLFL